MPRQRAALADWLFTFLSPAGGFGADGRLSAGTSYQVLSVVDWITGPILAAARAGDTERLRHLLDGGDPDVRDLQGWTT